MKLITLVTLLFLGLNASAQGLEYEISNDGEVSFSFNEDFIQKKKIQCIDYKFSSKRPNRIIKPQIHNTKKVCFTKEGKLKTLNSVLHILNARIEEDIKCLYRNGELYQRIEKDAVGYYSEFYTYSSDTCYINIYRGDIYSGSSYGSQDSTLMTSKATVTTNKSLKELNSQNIEIKSTLFEYDSLGLLQRELTKYSLSPARVDKRYTYNENGQVSNLSIATIQNTKNFKFIYDRLSSLKSIEYYLEDKLVSTYEIVYNSNGWVSALLKHDLTSQLIEIEELEYSFYK